MESWKIMRAVSLLRKALREDAGLKIGYVANISMLLYDRYRGRRITRKSANEMAEDILELIFRE